MHPAAETTCAVHAKIEFSIAKGFSQRQKEQGDFHKNINKGLVAWCHSFLLY